MVASSNRKAGGVVVVVADANAAAPALLYLPQSSPLSMTTTQVSGNDDNDGIDDATATLRPPRNAAEGDRDAPLRNG